MDDRALFRCPHRYQIDWLECFDERTSGEHTSTARRANHLAFFATPLSSPIRKNISLSPSGKSKLEVPPSCPEEGRWPSSRTLGWDAVDAAASGALDAAGRDEPRERSRARKTNGASTPSPKLRQATHGRPERLVEVAAYGEVVWSWHPLLMLNRRRFWRAQPGATRPSIRR